MEVASTRRTMTRTGRKHILRWDMRNEKKSGQLASEMKRKTSGDRERATQINTNIIVAILVGCCIGPSLFAGSFMHRKVSHLHTL